MTWKTSFKNIWTSSSYFRRKKTKSNWFLLLQQTLNHTFCKKFLSNQIKELSNKIKVCLEKLNQSKSFLLNQVLSIKALKLRPNFTWEGKQLCLCSKNWKWSKNRVIIYRRLNFYFLKNSSTSSYLLKLASKPRKIEYLLKN